MIRRKIPLNVWELPLKKVFLYLFVAILSLSAGVAYQLYNQSDFSTLEGNSYTFKDLHGKWVVINYFAEWCAPCLREIPELNEFHDTIQGQENVVLFGVSYDAIQDHELSLLAEKYDIQFPLINEIESSMPFEMPKYLPATYLIKPDGSLAGQLLGEQSQQTLLEAIKTK
jgi:peroxiredoxin